MSTSSSHTQNSGHKVRRPRAARACNLCRAKKNKCDELYPCTYCRNRSIECVYQGQDMSRRRFTPEYVKSLEDQVKSLSAVAASGQTSSAGESASPATSGLGGHEDFIRHELPSDLPRVNATFAPTTRSRQIAGQEVSGVNRHTRNVEFYGSSSTVALLSHIQRSGDQPVVAADTDSEHTDTALLSNLHNPAFTPPQADPYTAASNGPSHDAENLSSGHQTHFRQCRGFLQNFFSTIHYIHPILDKTSFFDRCEHLWSGGESSRQPSSFTALYYSLLSLGALVGYRDDEPIGGIDNQRWSRKFFDEAKTRCSALGLATDLEMVQCYFFLAKVCQNELNAHWSYMYIGLAVRTALAIGINREPGPNNKEHPAQLKAETRTWWCLYSLEEELSFAMGRPSSLGSDLYHNRRFPIIEAVESAGPNSGILDPAHCAIIRHMVDFSKITRNVCLSVYLSETSAARTVSLAHQIEQDLDNWIAALPEAIRPRGGPAQPLKLASTREAQWMKRQKLVLNIRYHNLRILLFGSILLTSPSSERSIIPGAYEGIQKCLDSAKQTIEIMYQTYQYHDFFRTWFYNTTYTVFAASMLLVYINQGATEAEVEALLRLVGMAIEVLETMDECIVALKSAKLLQKAVEKARNKVSATTMTLAPIIPSEGDANMLHWRQCWGPMNLLEQDVDLDLAFQFADFESMYHCP